MNQLSGENKNRLTNDEVLLNTKELSHFMKISQRQVYVLINRGDLTAYKISGRLYFIRGEVLQAIKDRKVVPKMVTG